jgi:hypothetical protein
MRHDEFLGLLHYLLHAGTQPTLLWAGRWELAFWALAILLAALLAIVRPHGVPRAEQAFIRLSQHRAACVWGIGVSVLVLRTLLLPLIPIPVPVVLDEYSYLLGADTFASGRVTNPTHPMWLHFETFNVNMRPSYQSMYPPAQGLVLALGEKLAGQPWIGVLLSVALMCALFCWMLQAWLPPQWALLGGLYAVARYGIFSYWINSYWGGAVAAIGGALLLGSFGRLRQRFCWRQCLLFAAGLVILANSRPLEGFLFSLPLIAGLALLCFGAQAPPLGRLVRMLAPALLLLVAAGGAMLYYNWRGTGDPLRMAYTVNQETYHVTRPFLFQKPYPIPQYHNPQMRTFYMFHEYPDLLYSRTGWGLRHLMQQKFFCYYVFFAWPLALLFIPGLLLAAGNRELRIVLFSVLLMFAGLTLQIWPAHGHYAAPATGAILLIQLYVLGRLRHAQLPEELPAFLRRCLPPLELSRAVVLLLAIWMLVPFADRLWNPYAFDSHFLTGPPAIPKQIDRERIQNQLRRTSGEHLVIVHYQQRDVPSVEWVYNRADIDHAKVVWARDMGAEANQELLDYFRNRRIWYVDRAGGAILQPYTYTDPASGVSCHPASGLPPDCELIGELGLPQPVRP